MKELRIALHLHLPVAPTMRLLEMFGAICYVSWEENMQKLLRPEISTSTAHIQVQKKREKKILFVDLSQPCTSETKSTATVSQKH